MSPAQFRFLVGVPCAAVAYGTGLWLAGWRGLVVVLVAALSSGLARVLTADVERTPWSRPWIQQHRRPR